MRVLVTGASGFLGGHLARALRPDGAVGASRAPQSDAAIEWVRPFDPADARAARVALTGVDVVIHAAGRAHVLRETASDPHAAFRDVNVTTTSVMVEAAREAGVRQFLLLSSISVFGDAVSGLVTDTTPTAPNTPYGASRLDAERVVRDIADIRTTILRLPMMYGPGMKGNPLRLFDLVAGGLPLPLGSISNRRSLLYVGNLVQAVRGLLTATVPTGTTFLAADEQPVSTPALIREIAAEIGRPARVFPCPLPVLRGVAWSGNRLMGARFPLGPDALWRLSSSLVVDAAPLWRIVGAPRHGRRDGLAATAAWYTGRR